MYISRRCSELVAHIQNTNTQYNLPQFEKKISRKYNRDGVAERFEYPEVRKSVEVDLAIIDSFNEILKKLGISNRISERLPLACQGVSERFLK